MSEPKDFDDIKGKFLRVPLSFRGWPKWLVFALSAVGVLYILNPTLGVFEFLPDNLPIIGNLDEGLAYLLVYYGIMEFVGPYLNFQSQLHPKMTLLMRNGKRINSLNLKGCALFLPTFL